MRSQLTVFMLSGVALLLTTRGVEAQAQLPDGQVVQAVEALGHADGTTTYRRLTFDPQTGEFSAVPSRSAENNHNHVPRKQADFQRLLVRQSSKWRRSTTQGFRWADKIVPGFPAPRALAQNRGRIRQVMNIVHQRKGHLMIPRFMLLNRQIAVRNIADPVLEYQQFDFDNINAIVRTSDNRFFRFDKPDITSRAVRFERATCTLAGGVFRCPFSITECDIYLRARTAADLGFFEDSGGATQKRALAGHYKFCQGHDSNTWGHDLSGTRNREVTPAAFDRNLSRTWKLEREEDQALYAEVGAAAIPTLPGRFLLPRSGAVVDVGHLKPPEFDPLMSMRDNAFRYDALALTDLKGFRGAKDLTLEVFRGKSTRVKDRILGKLRGASINRDLTLNGRRGFRRYLLSYLYISRDGDFNKLLNVLRQPENQGLAVRGLGYDYVMEVTIVVTGFEATNGPRRRVQTTCFLVWNEGEERDPDVGPVPFLR